MRASSINDPDSSLTPLVVDLDGTLIYSDLLWDGVFAFLKRNWAQAWRLLSWLLQGKAAFKERLACWIDIEPETLPYDRELLTALAEQKARGRIIVMATGSARRWADKVADHLGLFEHVHATEHTLNLTSLGKADELARRYGANGFDYIGNARADLAIWQVSRRAFSVGRKPFHLRDGRTTEPIGSRRSGTARGLLRAMRLRHWIKNLLVFVPLLASHTASIASIGQAVAAFFAFSCCASGAYLLNDVLDAADDRRHPVKRLRPVAAGVLAPPAAAAASVALSAFGLALAASMGIAAGAVLALYLAGTICYSAALKRMMMVDVLVLSLLYCLRIVGGGASTGITPSFWLLAFSFFLFLSLGLLKRHSELVQAQRQGRTGSNGRGYRREDGTVVGVMGINSAFVSVTILMLYLNSSAVQALYTRPTLLYGVVPLAVFWLGRLWVLSFRGEVAEDPVLYLTRDASSLLVIALSLGTAIAASW